jgi:hypothetical protein
VVALVCIEGFYVCQTLFELLSWYQHLPPTQPVNSSDRQSKNIIHNRNFIPAPLASQSAPLMNTCWPVLRTCNSNTFVLFWASCIHKKNFYNPKITPLQIMFSKRIFLLRKKKYLQITLTFYIIKQELTKQEMFFFFQLRFSGTSTKAPCEIKSVSC